jgi:hypothetical protein
MGVVIEICAKAKHPGGRKWIYVTDMMYYSMRIGPIPYLTKKHAVLITYSARHYRHYYIYSIQCAVAGALQ